MVINDYNILKNKINKLNKKSLYSNICHNIKKLRKERYLEFKKQVKSGKISSRAINPYTTENIAKLLDYNHTHYKRFESDNDKTKQIPLEKIIKLSLIFDVNIDEIISK